MSEAIDAVWIVISSWSATLAASFLTPDERQCPAGTPSESLALGHSWSYADECRHASFNL